MLFLDEYERSAQRAHDHDHAVRVEGEDDAFLHEVGISSIPVGRASQEYNLSELFPSSNVTNTNKDSHSRRSGSCNLWSRQCGSIGRNKTASMSRRRQLGSMMQERLLHSSGHLARRGIEADITRASQSHIMHQALAPFMI